MVETAENKTDAPKEKPKTEASAEEKSRQEALEAHQPAAPKTGAAEPESLDLAADSPLPPPTDGQINTTDARTGGAMHVKYTPEGSQATVYPKDTKLDADGNPPEGVKPIGTIKQTPDGTKVVTDFQTNADGTSSTVVNTFGPDQRPVSTETTKLDPTGKKVGTDVTTYKTDDSGKVVSSETAHKDAKDADAGKTTTTYTYDSQGRVTGEVAVSVDASGKPVSTVSTDRTYGADGSVVVNMKTEGPDGKPKSETSATYDADGNRTSTKEKIYKTDGSTDTTTIDVLPDGTVRRVNETTFQNYPQVTHRSTTEVRPDGSATETSEDFYMTGQHSGRVTTTINPDGSMKRVTENSPSDVSKQGELYVSKTEELPPGSITKLSADGDPKQAVLNLIEFGDGSIAQGLSNVQALGRKIGDQTSIDTQFAAGVDALNHLASNANITVDQAMDAIGIYGAQDKSKKNYSGDHEKGIQLLKAAGRDPEAMKRVNEQLKAPDSEIFFTTEMAQTIEGDPLAGVNILSQIGDGDPKKGMSVMKQVVGDGDADEATKRMETDGDGSVAGAVPVYMQYSTDGSFAGALNVIRGASDNGTFGSARSNIISLSDAATAGGAQTFQGGTDNLLRVAAAQPGGGGTLDQAITSVRGASDGEPKTFEGGVANIVAASDTGTRANGIDNIVGASDDKTFDGGVANIRLADDNTDKPSVAGGLANIRLADDSPEHTVAGGTANIRLADDGGDKSVAGGIANIKYASDDPEHPMSGGIANIRYASDGGNSFQEGVANLRTISDDKQPDGTGSLHGGIDNARYTSDDHTVHGGLDNIIAAADDKNGDGKRTVSEGITNLMLTRDGETFTSAIDNLRVGASDDGTVLNGIQNVRATSDDGQSYEAGIANVKGASDQKNGDGSVSVANGLANIRAAGEGGSYKEGLGNITYAADDLNGDGKATISEGIANIRYAADGHDTFSGGLNNLRAMSDESVNGEPTLRGGIDNARIVSDNNSVRGGIDNVVYASDNGTVSQGIVNIKDTSDTPTHTFGGGVENLRRYASDDGTVHGAIENVRHAADGGDSYSAGLANIVKASDVTNPDGSKSISDGMQNIRELANNHNSFEGGLENLRAASDSKNEFGQPTVSGGIDNIRSTSDDGTWKSALSNIERAAGTGGSVTDGINNIRGASDNGQYSTGLDNLRNVASDGKVSTGINNVIALASDGQFSTGVDVVKQLGGGTPGANSENPGSFTKGAENIAALGGGSFEQGAQRLTQLTQETGSTEAVVAHLTAIGNGNIQQGAELYAANPTAYPPTKETTVVPAVVPTVPTVTPEVTRLNEPGVTVTAPAGATVVAPLVEARLDMRPPTNDPGVTVPLAATNTDNKPPVVPVIDKPDTPTPTVEPAGNGYNRSAFEEKTRSIDELIQRFSALTQPLVSRDTRIEPQPPADGNGGGGTQPVRYVAGQSTSGGDGNPIIDPRTGLPITTGGNGVRFGSGESMLLRTSGDGAANALFDILTGKANSGGTANGGILAPDGRTVTERLYSQLTGPQGAAGVQLTLGAAPGVTVNGRGDGTMSRGSVVIGTSGVTGADASSIANQLRAIAGAASVSSSTDASGTRSTFTIRTMTGQEITVVATGGRIIFVRANGAGGRGTGFGIDAATAFDSMRLTRRLTAGGGVMITDGTLVVPGRRWTTYKKRQLIGVEIALALLLTSTAIARRLEEEKEEEAAADAIAQREQQFARTSYQIVTRPTWLVRPGEDLVKLAEHLFHEAEIGVLIADLNVGQTRESLIDGKRIVELKTRQRIELPVWQDIMEFHKQIAQHPVSPQDLITVVTETAVDNELVQATMGRVMGVRPVATPAIAGQKPVATPAGAAPAPAPIPAGVGGLVTAMARTVGDASRAVVVSAGFGHSPVGSNQAPVGMNQAPVGMNQAPVGLSQAPVGFSVSFAEKAVGIINEAAATLLQQQTQSDPSAPAVAFDTNNIQRTLRPKLQGA